MSGTLRAQSCNLHITIFGETGFLRVLQGTGVSLPSKTKQRGFPLPVLLPQNTRVGPEPRRPPGAPWLLQTMYGWVKFYPVTLKKEHFLCKGAAQEGKRQIAKCMGWVSSFSFMPAERMQKVLKQAAKQKLSSGHLKWWTYRAYPHCVSGWGRNHGTSASITGSCAWSDSLLKGKQAQLCCLQYQMSTTRCWAALCQLECTCSTEEAPRSLTWSTTFCGTVMKGWLLFTNVIGKRLEIIHTLNRKTKLWLSKTKHQSFLQEHQKAFITDLHRSFSANRTFWQGKIKSFCIEPSVLTATVISKSSPSNEILKEKLMARAENDKEKNLGCRGDCCALRAGKHKTAERPDNPLFPSVHWLHKVQGNRVFDSNKMAVFLYSNPSKIQTVIVHTEQQCEKCINLHYSGRKNPAEERHLL